MDLQAFAAVVNEAHLPEPVHEEIHPRPRCAHHLCEGLLTHLGDYSLGFTFLAEMSQQEQHAGEPFLSEIEKLVNLIRFVSDVPRQQIGYEHV